MHAQNNYKNTFMVKNKYSKIIIISHGKNSMVDLCINSILNLIGNQIYVWDNYTVLYVYHYLFVWGSCRESLNNKRIGYL